MIVPVACSVGNLISIKVQTGFLGGWLRLIVSNDPSSFSFFFFFLSLSSFRRRFRAFDQQKFLTVDSGTLLKRVADDGVGQEI